MITFLGWLFLFFILMGIAYASPIFGIILFIIAGFFNPLFWGVPIIMVILLIIIILTSNK